MQRKITLRVLGVDLDDDQTVPIIADHLDDLIWSVVDGCARVTLIIEQPRALVGEAIETARRIESRLSGAKVDRVDEELVGIPDIAARLKLNRETIRAWAGGSRGPGNFPIPIGSLGGGDRGPAKIWRWADVNGWLDRNYSLGDGYSYGTDAEIAEVNAYLTHADYMVVASVQNGPYRPPAFWGATNSLIGIASGKVGTNLFMSNPLQGVSRGT